jgi:hypothetical protein
MQFTAGHISSFTMTNTSSADNKICARFCPASVLFHPQLRFKIPQPAHNTLRSSPSVSKHYTRGLSSKLRNLRTRPCHLVHCTHNLYSKTHNLQTTSGHRLRDTALTISVQKSAICKQTTPRHPSRDTLHLAMDALGYWRHSCNVTLQELLTTPTAPSPQPMTYRDSFIRKSTTRYKSSMQMKRQYLNGTKVDSVLHQERKTQNWWSSATAKQGTAHSRLELSGIRRPLRFKLWQPKATTQTSYMATIGIGEQRRLA